MNWKTKAVLFLSMAVLAFSTMACEKEGEAEKAGKKIDKAFSDAKKKINESTK